MRSLKKIIVGLLCVVVIPVFFLAAGCATSCQIKKMQDQINMVSDKADQSTVIANKAKASAQDCCGELEKHIKATGQAADRAETAAARAEDAAAKAEAVFMKHMMKK